MASITLTIATILSCIIPGIAASPRAYDACTMCACTDRERVVNCTGLKLHERINVNYPDKMRMLILNNNNYTYLDAGQFTNAPDLVELKLQSNYIKAVHENAFKGLRKLERLFLCLNSIEALPEGVFDDCGNLTYLSLQYNSLTIESLDSAIRSAPNLKTLDITGLSMGFLPEYGFPVGFSYLHYLQILYLEECIDHLPATLFKHLANSSLTYLSLARKGFVNISIDVFVPLPKLKQLELSRTLITVPTAEVIFEAIAQANLSLEVLNIRHNFIYDDQDNILEPENFQPLSNISLKVLHMEKSSGGFQGHVTRHFFKYLPSLQELYLDNCRLHNIHAQAFKDLHELTTLSLAGNYLNCYTGCGFLVNQHFRHLLHLDLSDNVISDQAVDLRFTKEYFPQLQSLNLQNNKIQYLERDIFGDLKHLHRLDLSFNPLAKIEPQTFVNLHHLQYLRITDSPLLESLDSQVFKGLRSLRTLVLNDNNIMSLGKKAFDGLTSLESLSMRNNKLGRNHRLNYANFSVQSTSLTFLDLGENELEEFPFGFISGHPQINSVYLDHNRISALQLDMFGSIESITLLDLSYNDLLYIDASVFSSREFLNLHTLSLAGNPLMCDCSIGQFLHWIRESRKKGQIFITAEERHTCFGPQPVHGVNLFEFEPSQWECHIKLYAITLLSVCIAVILACMCFVCVCKRKSRDSDDGTSDEDLENEMEPTEETGSLTHINGHVTHVSEPQTSSSVDSSQSSITGFCVPLRNFRRKKTKADNCDGNGHGHVLLESDDSEPEDTIVEDAVV